MFWLVNYYFSIIDAAVKLVTMKVSFIWVLVVLAASGARPVLAEKLETVREPVHVVDGDSIRMNGNEIRLEGIDAPEYDQRCVTRDDCSPWRCGEQATQALAQLVAGRAVQCEPRGDGVDKYGRAIMECFIEEKSVRTSINRYMVKHGHAAAYLKYSDAYKTDQTYAKRRKRGIHSGFAISPSIWRRLDKDEKPEHIRQLQAKCLKALERQAQPVDAPRSE